MDKNEFTHTLTELTRQYDDGGGNVACTGSTKLERCTHCLFCHSLVNCYHCTHTVDSRESSFCVHAAECTYCHHCSYCTRCDHTTQSAYLIGCSWCSECTYCFGCVGLYKKDFHILNKPYARKEYFEIVQKLGRDLGIKMSKP
jgi:hypothetical protein